MQETYKKQFSYQVFINNSITGSKKGKDMGNEVAFSILEGFPVNQIFWEINLLSSPERSLSFLVHLPDVMVLDRKDYKASRLVLQQWLYFSWLLNNFLDWLMKKNNQLHFTYKISYIRRILNQKSYKRGITTSSIWKTSYLIWFNFYDILRVKKKRD